MNLKVDKNRYIVACGERQGNEYKRIRFEQSYKVPENSNIDDTTAKFEDEILFIVIPKIIKAPKEPHPEISSVPEAVQEEKETEANTVEDKVPQAVLKEEAGKGNDQITDAAANGSIHERDSHNHHGNEELSEEEDDDTVDEEEETTTTTEEEDFHDAKMENQCSLMKTLGKQLKKNKGILITAVLAFSLGVIVSQKFQPHEK